MNKRIVFAAAVLTASSLMVRAEVTNLSCIQTGPNEYKPSYTLTGNSHLVQIFASADSTGANGIHAILKTAETEVTVHAGSAGERIYFFLKPDHGRQREVSIRHVARRPVAHQPIHKLASTVSVCRSLKRRVLFLQLSPGTTQLLTVRN